MSYLAPRSPPKRITKQLPEKCVEGLALALANEDDGAIMVIQWCNKPFQRITGYSSEEAIGQRGTILIGQDMDQSTHLLIIDKLMNWEAFSVTTATNRKNGTKYQVSMSWNPLSDPLTGDHWWLCSLIELDEDIRLLSKTNSFNLGSHEYHGRFAEEITRLENENTRWRQLATSVVKESSQDSLTGLFNRRYFDVELKAWIAALKSGGDKFAALFVDLDWFKSVNDSLGHDAGDGLLVWAADILRRVTEPTDLVARVGGDEFIVLRPLGNSALSISQLADDIVRQMNTTFTYENNTITPSASVGIAIAGDQSGDPEEVVSSADAALYQAKEQGRARWSFFTAEMRESSMARKKTASELLQACEKDEFIPFFQPVVDAITSQIVSVEVLVRWQHPTLGLLAPGSFLDVADSMGIIGRIDKLVLDQLRSAVARFEAAGASFLNYAINVSLARLEDPSFVHDLTSMGVHPKRLTAEILESVYLDQMKDVVRWALGQLNELGVTVAVDDFGTGHASVQGLLKVRPALLKVDRQFIRPVVEDETARALFKSLVGIGKNLNMRVVAEGIETHEQGLIAQEFGCDLLQGFYYGRPMSEGELRKHLERVGQIAALPN